VPGPVLDYRNPPDSAPDTPNPAPAEQSGAADAD
jgi:hypothetical protein